MMEPTDWIFSEEDSFEEKAARMYRLQRAGNPVYDRFCRALGSGEGSPEPGEPYPLLPVRAFAEQPVITAGEGEPREPELTFRSSGTGEGPRSIHRLQDASLYRASVLNGFRRHYRIDESVLWAYVPGYSDNPDSSLVRMLQILVEESGSPLSRFLPLGEPADPDAVREVRESGRMLILFGAAFGLLDLLEEGGGSLSVPRSSLVIETGGMKTRRREIGRGELHRRLSEGFGIDISRVHSEYGMAELLSQAYATGGEWFRCPPWLKATVRDPEAPMRPLPPGREGLLGFIDLVNRNSCSFLLTGDRGALNHNGDFRVEGRWNEYDLRGCNFMIDSD